MIEAFRSYIRDENLFTSGDKLVLAVSGGVDSMVMLSLFQQLDHEFVVAHCNFNLRGAESDGEEVFIRDYCGAGGIELYVKHFDTREYAVLEGISIEMAARRLRYDWFAELLDELSYSFVATAHHQDDLIETMLINLSRGTGIRGLSGILPRNGRIIRPLLFTTRRQILAFAREKEIDFRNDSSNDELLYQRNVIRHSIIPAFEEMYPAFRKNASKTALILRETEKIYRQKLEEIRHGILERSGAETRLSIRKLQAMDPLPAILFELLHPFGFNSNQVHEIQESFNSEAGKTFFSGNYRLVKDREFLIITSREHEKISRRFYIDADCLQIREPLSLHFELILKTPDYKFSRDRMVADLDYDRLHFPLIIKKWEPGEYFQPLGLSGFKKLSDFFIDEKMSIPEKEATWILYSGKNVIWVTGKRLDDRYKITSGTTRVLRIRMGEYEGLNKETGDGTK